MVADSLHDYLPLSILLIFTKTRRDFVSNKKRTAKIGIVLQISSAKLKLYGDSVKIFSQI